MAPGIGDCRNGERNTICSASSSGSSSALPVATQACQPARVCCAEGARRWSWPLTKISARCCERSIMHDEPDKGERKHPKQEPREQRLKLALRENLKRRKSQARGRSDGGRMPRDADTSSSEPNEE